MLFFVDTALLSEIQEAASLGILDGVTTNPSLMAKAGVKDFDAHYRAIAQLTSGPVSAEVISTTYADMIAEARHLHSLAPNIVVKIPFTPDGVKALHTLKEENIPTNCTLIFSPLQALIAAKAGATYVSPFIGRLDDVGHEGMELIRQIRQIFDNYGFETKILAASIRHPLHVLQAALEGADIATMPFSVLKQLFQHPLTDKGLAQFLADYEKLHGRS
ncbi:MAG: fructose-6-phosphate aldolase [Bacteroidia bacterium]|nr:fructose-6-phosphate aldolase [Bacteroidia bacterium]MCX7764256.1 fructose-6-phosphate aldolase [Bacteroidia bacterium]MDW8057443.1 fructose-6-phosphate aldolase [Bacteroidia bacterium]